MIKLSDTQISMLQQSDKDIQAGKLISQEHLDELDRQFLDHQNGIGKTDTWEETIAMAEKILTDKKKNKRD